MNQKTIRRKLTMDRVFEVSANVNDEWLAANHKLKQLSVDRNDDELKAIYDNLNQARIKFANLITAAQDDNWRFIAEANGVILPPDQKPPISDGDIDGQGE